MPLKNVRINVKQNGKGWGGGGGGVFANREPAPRCLRPVPKSCILGVCFFLCFFFFFFFFSSSVTISIIMSAPWMTWQLLQMFETILSFVITDSIACCSSPFLLPAFSILYFCFCYYILLHNVSQHLYLFIYYFLKSNAYVLCFSD